MPLTFRSAFFLACGLTVVVPFFFPSLHLLFFAPPLVMALYQKGFYGALWRALFCGLLFDIFSSTPYFGTTPLCYTITAALLFRLKQSFFEDNPSTLPIMTFAFSSLATFLGALFALFMGEKGGFGIGPIVTNFFLMPLADALASLLLFALPFQLYARWRRLPRREE